MAKVARLRSAVTSGSSTSFVCYLMESLVVKSYQLMCGVEYYAMPSYVMPADIYHHLASVFMLPTNTAERTIL